MRTLQLTITPVVPPGEVHISTDWEIASDSEFSNIVHVVNSTTDLTTYNAAAISPNIDIYARGRMVTDLGTMNHFTATAVDVVTTPLVNMPSGQHNVAGTSAFTTDAYVSIDTTNTHSSTDWVITNSSDNSVLWESLDDTVNLTTIDIPIGILEKQVSYRMNARHNGSVIASAYGAKSFMIVTDDTIVTPIIATPDIGVVEMVGGLFVNTLTPTITTAPFTLTTGTDTHVSTDWHITDVTGLVDEYVSLGDTTNLLSIVIPPNILANNTTFIANARHNGAVAVSAVGTGQFDINTAA